MKDDICVEIRLKKCQICDYTTFTALNTKYGFYDITELYLYYITFVCSKWQTIFDNKVILRSQITIFKLDSRFIERKTGDRIQVWPFPSK